MAVCGRCYLCGAKFDCGPRTRCVGCNAGGYSTAENAATYFACRRCDTTHYICAGCQDVMHGLGGLAPHEEAVLVALLARMGGKDGP